MAQAISLERFHQSNISLLRGQWEKVLATGGFIIIVLIQMSVAGSFYLLRRHLWYDEILTHTLVTDPDFGHALRGLASGVETHPPTLYAMLRLFTWATGGATEVTLRLFPFLCIGIAFWGIYLVLRRSFSPLPAFGAVLALWCHPLVVVQAFEARSYAPWLAGISWFTYLLGRCRRPRIGLVSRILLASSAAFVCLIHYFGVISVGLVTAFEILARRRAGAPLSAGLASVAVGPVALLACFPLLLRQRAAMSVPT